MPELLFNFYGVPVLLASDAHGVLEALRRDFEYFTASAGTNTAAILLTLELKSPSAPPQGRPLLRTKDYAIFDQGGWRRIVYSDQACAEYDFSSRRGRICCADAARLHELAYLAVLSRVGEELDGRGWHRIHALGFESNGKGGLLLLPSGAGKSVLALELLRSTSLGLLSDDTPLLAPDLQLRAFPLRLGFQSTADLGGVPEIWLRSMSRRHYGLKRLVDLGFFRARVRSGVPVTWLLIGERQNGASSRIGPVSRMRAAAALVKYLVIGVGIAQMSEYMLRPAPAELVKLLRIASLRLRTSCRMLLRVKPRRFMLGDDPRANAAALAAFLEAQDRGLRSGGIS